MGSEIDIGRSFWKRYFHSEEDAKKIDIFDLISASITVASFKKPNEFRSRRLQIMESLFTDDSKAKKGTRLIVKNPSKINQEHPVIVQGCKDQACKDEIFSRHKKFDNLERELDECAQPIGIHNVNVPYKKRKAEVSKIWRSGKTIKADKKRKVEETKGIGGMDSYEYKFEASKRRFEEKNQQIEKAKGRVQILDMKEIAPPPRFGRDGKPKGGFGSSIKKIQKARF